MRVPTVAYRAFLQTAWPGFALAAAGVGRAWPWIALGVLRAAMMVGWSENAAATAGLWAAWADYETVLVLGALALSTARAGWWWAAVWAALAWRFYRVAPFDGSYSWEHYSDKTSRVAVRVAGGTPSQELLLTGAVFGLLAAGGRRGGMVIVACLPVLYVTAASEYWIWHWDYVMGSVVALSYAGAAALLIDAHRATSRDRAR